MDSFLRACIYTWQTFWKGVEKYDTCHFHRWSVSWGIHGRIHGDALAAERPDVRALELLLVWRSRSVCLSVSGENSWLSSMPCALRRCCIRRRCKRASWCDFPLHSLKRAEQVFVKCHKILVVCVGGPTSLRLCWIAGISPTIPNSA